MGLVLMTPAEVAADRFCRLLISALEDMDPRMPPGYKKDRDHMFETMRLALFEFAAAVRQEAIEPVKGGDAK